MEENKNKRSSGGLGTLGSILVILIVGMFFLVLLLMIKPDILNWNNSPNDASVISLESAEVENEIIDSIHVETGLVVGEGLQLVIANCTNCHSAKLVTQNRLTKEGWTQVIRWMQETQGLWDLGPSEAQIVEYLATHYAPQARGRRKALEVEWYSLD